MNRYKLKTAPTIYPVSLADVKRNLRIPTTDTDTDRDTLLQDLIYAAIDASQNATGRQYCRATYTLYLDAYPEGDEIEIELGPVDAISSVKYYAQDAAVLTTVNSADYQLDNSELTARLRFLESFSADADKMNPVEIEFTTGWATAAAVPADLKQAVILRACDMYLSPENRTENIGMGQRVTSAELKERNFRVVRY